MMRVRQINVMRATVTNALDPNYMPVTLPAAPWEDGEDLAKVKQARQRERDRKRLFAEQMHAAAISRKPGKAGICPVRGCSVALSADNKAGVCRKHMHHALCGCPDCNRRRGQ